MAARRRTDDFEDDGRVIADMSAVERPSLLGHLPERRGPREPRAPRRPKVELTTKERLWMMLGALRAGLTVGCVYVAFLGVIVFGLLAFWMFLQ
ncbi:hypothetical protein [Thermophilibacter provencensis]|uniref:Uncharacterized protein n=1 Tax=Thermophilibacter provencensis TaxID=1852386 RepID=A0ABT7V3E2_9ACTN|nr:hypothetical protein [Thermophilibacter provencensis]MDM8271120.1 hypothetical protein [Thermophilibacter provencensis]